MNSILLFSTTNIKFIINIPKRSLISNRLSVLVRSCHWRVHKVETKDLGSGAALGRQWVQGRTRIWQAKNLILLRLFQITQSSSLWQFQMKSMAQPMTTSMSNFYHRLPKLDLPIFSGDILTWQTSWDSFQTTVHNNPLLTNVQKFSYLKSQLSHSAENCIYLD